MGDTANDTASVGHVTDGDKPPPSTENEGTFKGPKFDPPVYRQRYAAVCELVKKQQAKKVLDFGCAEAKLVKALICQDNLIHLEELVGVDIDQQLLEESKFRIRPFTADYLRPRTHPFQVSLYQGSIAEADERFIDFDIIACIELIEHLQPDILDLMPEAVFGQLSPKVVIVTTPNVEFNVLFPDLKGFRHYDHKFEWTRAEFQEWSNTQALKYNYTVTFDGIAAGPKGTEHLGCCSQVAVFERISSYSASRKGPEIGQPYNLIAEVQFPYKKDTRTEEEKILQEVEYILWMLSSQEEAHYSEESDMDSQSSDKDDKSFHGEENHLTHDEDCAKTHVYLLKELLGFSSLRKFCNDIEKLRSVLKDSSRFCLTEDECGVLWQHQSSPQWSSEESDTGWDVCGNDQEVNESKRPDSAWTEPENWDTTDEFSSEAIIKQTTANTEVCWDSSNDCNTKYWDGEDWTKFEEYGADDEFEEENNFNLYDSYTAAVSLESDGSEGEEISGNDIDGLVWITENVSITDGIPE